MKDDEKIDQHLSIFRPYNRDPWHEDQLTRAALIVMRLVPLAHEAFLGLVGKGRLSTLPSPEFDMQTEDLVPPATDDGSQEVEEFVSVLLSPDENFKRPATVEVSARRARYDGVIQYGPKLLVAIESKLVEGVGDEQATEINPKNLKWGSTKLILVKWHDLLDQWWNLAELGILNPTEAAVLADFFDFSETNFGDLLPFTDLGRTRANTKRQVRRLCLLFEYATGIDAKASNRRATIKFPGQLTAMDRAGLWVEADAVHLAVWPAELSLQYKHVYGDAGIVSDLIALAAEPGWHLNPNFHLGYRFSQPGQRWYPTPHIEGTEYVQRWQEDLTAGRAGGRTHDQIDSQFRQWITQNGYASNDDLPSLDLWLDEHPNIKIHVRPGVEVLRTWPLSEAVDLDRKKQFASEVRKAVDRILTALHEPKLESAAP